MRFTDLLDLPYCDNGKIAIDVLSDNKINAPEEVMIQVYSDHGRNEDFQRQYGSIILNKIIWKKIQVRGEELTGCSMKKSCQRWFESVASRIDDFKEKGWECVDVRSQVVSNWQANKTWLISPVFINGSLIKNSEKYHLVEGHTRLGVLQGLLKNQILSAGVMHEIWYGDY